jgi:hypothetical protein
MVKSDVSYTSGNAKAKFLLYIFCGHLIFKYLVNELYRRMSRRISKNKTKEICANLHLCPNPTVKNLHPLTKYIKKVCSIDILHGMSNRITDVSAAGKNT